MTQRLLFFLTLGFLILFLVGCGHTPVTRTIFDSLPSSSNDILDKIRLNPQFRYLRVTVKNRPLLMVLGYTEDHTNGKIETWYSKEGEVIRFQNGRIIATSGLETDWLNVNHSSLPSWYELEKKFTANYQRYRDQMPGYRFGIVEFVSVYLTIPPTNSKIVKTAANQFRWYEEVTLKTQSKLPSARFAIQDQQGVLSVVYGEQCLTEDFCLSWQLWPVSQ